MKKKNDSRKKSGTSSVFCRSNLYTYQLYINLYSTFDRRTSFEQCSRWREDFHYRFFLFQYYVRLTPSENLEETIDQEVDRFDHIRRKGRNTA